MMHGIYSDKPTCLITQRLGRFWHVALHEVDAEIVNGLFRGLSISTSEVRFKRSFPK